MIDNQNDYFPGGKWTLAGIESATPATSGSRPIRVPHRRGRGSRRNRPFALSTSPRSDGAKDAKNAKDAKIASDPPLAILAILLPNGVAMPRTFNRLACVRVP